jgi:hypothetical protein
VLARNASPSKALIAGLFVAVLGVSCADSAPGSMGDVTQGLDPAPPEFEFDRDYPIEGGDAVTDVGQANLSFQPVVRGTFRTWGRPRWDTGRRRSWGPHRRIAR